MLSKSKWEKTLLAPDATIQDAIQSLVNSSQQIVLVVSEGNEFVGTLTDGDIRRGLLSGLNLESSVKSIVNQNALVVPDSTTRDIAMHLMRVNKVHQLPIVDEKRKVIGIYAWDEMLVTTERNNLIIIMAGGLGSRLKPYTETTPKPMLKVAGKPMLEHIIERAKGEGLERFAIAIHYLGNQIEDYFGDGSRWGVKIDYIREEKALGTAGALGLLEAIPENPIIVTNADLLTDIRYGELLDFHQRNESFATMAARFHEWQNPFGIIKTKGVDIIGFEEKPVYRSYINAGVYVLEPETLSLVERDERCDMPVLFERIQDEEKKTIVYPVHESWMDLGTVDVYNEVKSSQ